MNVAKETAGYTATQILLHWVIAALVLFQLVIGEDIKPAYRAFSQHSSPQNDDLINANIHVYVGLLVLLLALWRLAIRLLRGVPAPPPEENMLFKRIAMATHFLLYLFIFGMPITGALAWYFDLDAMGEIHEFAKPIIIAVVGLHAAAALWQHFFVKSDVLVRMLRPAKQRMS
ncbi:cytochrome b [Mesorhizobium sp. ASY16-5R]|uniref:cytochrome b n=1 Tax=Mesorhizobium sp. ASY16-5R TaxID=3445772 RepID=UPI003F9F1785